MNQDRSNADVLRRAAHTFKSICATVGALALAELCKELERLCRQGKLGNIKELLAEVEREYGRLTSVLEKELQNSG